MITWTDYLPAGDQQTSKLLRGAHICVLPFDDGILMHRSTFSVAAAHHLPIITTRGETLEDPFVDRENVLLCLPQNPEALAATIKELISDPALQDRLRVGVRALSEQYFSWASCLARTKKVFEGEARLDLVSRR